MLSRIFVALRQYGFGNQRVLPSLDGLRAISIVLVLVSHLIGTQGFPRHIPLLDDVGLLGVRIFFVISGYLITSILLDEIARTGTVSLPRFYFRRTLRLRPSIERSWRRAASSVPLNKSAGLA
jgi:peptidoglycan/LPS O-acetylase OafA/YrhL